MGETRQKILGGRDYRWERLGGRYEVGETIGGRDYRWERLGGRD